MECGRSLIKTIFVALERVWGKGVCLNVSVFGCLQHISLARARLKELFAHQVTAQEVDCLVKTWPLVIINSTTPQEAIAYLAKRLHRESSPTLINFAGEVHTASRYVMNHPPEWCPVTHASPGRDAPFRFFEILEQHIAWMAYAFLQERVGFQSVVWLHDGFWVSPRPSDRILLELHQYLCRALNFDPAEPPLMRCDSLVAKQSDLLTQLNAPAHTVGPLAGTVTALPLPPLVTLHKRRTYTAAPAEQQEALEQQITHAIAG